MNARVRAAVWTVVALSLAAAPAWAARKPSKPRKAGVAPKVEEVAKDEAPRAPEIVLVPGAERAGDKETLNAFGIGLAAAGTELAVSHVLAASEAAEIGLQPGDVLLYLAGSEAKSEDAVASALAGRRPQTRVAAVVRRGLSVLTLESELPAVSRCRRIRTGRVSARKTTSNWLGIPAAASV